MSNSPLTGSRNNMFKSWLMAAALAVGLAACGGGGGGGEPVAQAPVAETPTTPVTPVSPVTPVTPVTPADPVTPTVPVPPPAESRFYASWTAAMQDASAGWPGSAPIAPQTFNNQTVRQVVRLSLAGDSVRLKLSNRFGKAPVTFNAVRVARSLDGGTDIDASTDRPVTFEGQATLTLAAGAEATSDAVALPVAALSKLTVSMYFAGSTAMPTVHSDGRQAAYIVPGNQVSAASMQPAGQDIRESYYALTAVEAFSAQPAKVVVAFGDSLTDGFGSTMGGNTRYPNYLDDRLKAAGQVRTGVVNAGISGNRWVNDFAGLNGNSRFDRDVLDVSGVTHAILLLGINDIGFAVEPLPSQPVTAQQIIDAMSASIHRANARGVNVMVGTLMPFKGAGYYSEAGEAKRQAVNEWIRNQGIAAVIDFDQVMRSPSDPAMLNPIYDSGDHLHVNNAGFAAMASAVDLSRL
jgi:lysophospholipase L1-like esterase